MTKDRRRELFLLSHPHHHSITKGFIHEYKPRGGTAAKRSLEWEYLNLLEIAYWRKKRKPQPKLSIVELELEVFASRKFKYEKVGG